MRQNLCSIQGSVWQMGKRDLSEEDIKAQYITPAIEKAGWDIILMSLTWKKILQYFLQKNS